MERTSPSYYIAPGAISVTPNANGSASDLAVYLVKGAKILVYSMGIPALGWNDSAYRQWTLTGRNRRLIDDTKPYTIYARLSKSSYSDGYLIFAPKVADGDNWLDKYAYVTIKGLAAGTANQNNSNYWYVKLGEVSLPVNGKRTVTLDTGILGTDQFNSEWNLDPDDMPLRVELTSAIDGVDAGDKPYVKWGKELILSAKLLEGWTNADVERFHHWTIQRNTGNASADTAWNFPTANSSAEHPSTGREVPNGNIALSHARGEGDMFGGAVSSLWTVIAWGLKEDDTSAGDSSSSASLSSSASTSSSVSSSASSSSSLPEYVEKYEVLAQGTINILAETAEQYALELSVNMVNYDPTTDTYNPSEGIEVMVRATDQKGEVFKMTKAQLLAASLAVQFSVAALDQWNTCVFDGANEAVAKANIPIEAFHLQKPVNVRIVKVSMSDSSSSSSSAKTTTYTELYRTPIAFVRNGEDSKEREWIFMRSQSAILFSSDASDTTKPLIPSLIAKGEVKPEEAAGGVDSNKNQDGWVPEGWWDDAQGTDDTYHYEYSAYRDYIREAAVDSSSSGSSSSSADAVSRGGHWGDFSTPRIWSYYAEDAVSYRCRWTLAGVEVYQLKCAYTGAFRGALPLVATLMKRVGNGQEQEVTGKAVIVLSCDGIDFSKTFNADNPTFSVDANNADTKDFIQYLNNVALNGLSTVFTVNGEAHTFSIPVIREADEDSVKDTLDKYGSDTFLSKVKDDTAQGLITFLKGLVANGASRMDGLEVNDLIASIAQIYNLYARSATMDSAEVTNLTANDATINRLEVTGAAHFFQLIIDQVRSVGGRMILSAASCEAMHVEEMSGCHRVYFLADDGENGVTNNWQVNDLAICQSFNLGAGSYNDVSNKYYWRKVVGCSYNAKTYDFDTTERKYYYIDLSNIYGEYDANSNAAPSAGDSIVQLGNSNNAERASAIIMSAYNDTWIDSELKAPSISQYIGIGISTSSQPFNFTLAPYRHTWFSLDSNEIRGKFRVVTSSGADKDVGEIVEEMANALDGDIQFWFYDYAPSLDNAPAAEWIAQGTADQHVGDIFYDTSRSGDFTGGTTFKFVKTDENAYAWQPVTDAQTLKSLQLIADAADDGIISGGSELSRLYLTWKEQQTLFNSITATADDSSQKRELNTSWTNLCRMLNDDTPLGDISTGLPSWFSDLSVDITLSEHTYDGNELDAVTYREMWNAYYTAYANLQKVVNEQINTRIDDNTTEIATTRAEFEVTTNSIRSEVGAVTTKVTTIEGTVGGINTTVTKQNTKIEQLSDRITSEVTERITTIEETVDGINTTVTQQNSKIEQLSGRITSEVTELTNKISTVNDRVDAQDGTIDTLQEKVGKIPLKTDADLTEYTGSIEVTSRKIALEVSEITDVRRNMLMGTQFWKNVGYDTDGYRVNGSGATLIRRTADTINGHNSLEISSSSTSNTYGGIYFLNIPVEAGKSYTISVKAKRMSSSLGNGARMILHYKANNDQSTPTWQESQDMLTTSDTIGKWVLVTKTITPKAGDNFVNVIFCLVSSGTFRIAEPMMEESEEYTAWSPSPKDYAYVMGNMLPDSDTLKTVSSGEGLTQVYGRTADTDETGIYMAKGTATATYVASNSSWTAGYRTLITMCKTFSKGNSYILSFYARRTSAANDYAGLCVNFGSNVLIAEHSTGVSRYSEDQGSSPYSGYVKIKNVPNTWTRYWVHVITNENVTLTPNIYIEVTGGNVDSSGNISGNTGTFLIKKPKLEYGAAVTEWTTSADDLAEEETVANQLHKTGINITKGLIELNAENTIIDGDLHLKGVLVENYAEPTDSLVICDLVQNKSVSVAHGSQVLLPMITDTTVARNTASTKSYYPVNRVTEAGVKLTIAAKYNPNVAKWATGDSSLYTKSVMNTFHGYTTIVFADPRLASSENYYNDDRDNYVADIYPMGGGGYTEIGYKGGVFVCNGRRGRMLLMMPGQVLHLTSAIEVLDDTGEKVLLWYVDNGSDYTPIDKRVYLVGNESYVVNFTAAGGSAWPMEVGASSGSEYMECLFAPKQLSNSIVTDIATDSDKPILEIFLNS